MTNEQAIEIIKKADIHENDAEIAKDMAIKALQTVERWNWDKYLSLAGCYIYDKRTDQCGILSELCIWPLMGKCYLFYNAYMSKIHANTSIFVEDFTNGSVIFLLPFSDGYLKKEIEEMGQRHNEAIRAFFGDDFREDMIVSIPEKERQEMMRKLSAIETALRNLEQCRPIS